VLGLLPGDGGVQGDFSSRWQDSVAGSRSEKDPQRGLRESEESVRGGRLRAAPATYAGVLRELKNAGSVKVDRREISPG